MDKKDDSTIELMCSFCGKSQDEVKKLIAGPSVYICDECVSLCDEIIQEEYEHDAKEKHKDSLLKPIEMKESLDQYVIEQDMAKKVLSVAVHNHYKRIGANIDCGDVEIDKSNILLIGPTGSGKELVARAIHRRSRRADKKLAIFNCNHTTPDLVESELFGHLKGSFTGAVTDRIGLFEYADGGTVFLDEIGDLDGTAQGKLLRVLESGEIQRIGSPEIIAVDTRLICATHRDISQMVKDGQFREDLFYRLGGITITLPRLKDHSEDIPDLIDYFLCDYAIKNGHGFKVFDKSVIDFFTGYDWPGNVRQLLETVESLVALTPSSFISMKEATAYLNLQNGESGWHQRANSSRTFQERIRDFKRLLITQALARNENNISAAARELSLDPSNLGKMIKEAGMPAG